MAESQFDFTLLVDGPDDITEELEDKLFEAGCDDATISVSGGRLSLTFARVAESLKEAIVSAIKDVRRADVGVVNRVDDCSLITQSEIARRIGRSRQMVHQYINGDRGPGGFPKPACSIVDTMPLWYWCEVAYWLEKNSLIDEQELRRAQELAVINSILDLEMQRTIDPGLTASLMDELCLCVPVGDNA
ncbi:MAG: hypothetical protein RJS97_00745 [Parvibaculaceae bacterium]